MSPYEAWHNASAVAHIRLPADPDELDVVCSEAATCTLTPKGIQLENCMFNSNHLQEILRRAPRKPGKKAASIRVQVRFRRSLMAFIWVMDPQAKERLQVPNTDRTKASLSAFQVSVASAVKNKARDAGQKITTSQAIKRARDGARDLSKATTQATRRRALRLMGLLPEGLPVSVDKRPPGATKDSSSGKRSGASRKHSIQGDLACDPDDLLVTVDYDGGVPTLKTVSRPARQP